MIYLVICGKYDVKKLPLIHVNVHFLYQNNTIPGQAPATSIMSECKTAEPYLTQEVGINSEPDS